MLSRNIMDNFLDNWFIDKDIKFDFRVKKYEFPEIKEMEKINSLISSDDFFINRNNEMNSFIDDKPGIYFINMRFLTFENFISYLENNLSLIVKENDEYKWNYKKSRKMIFLLINNIRKIKQENYATLYKFTTKMNSLINFNNKFIILDKNNKKIYNFYNIYFTNKKDIIEIIKSQLFDNIYDQIIELINTSKLNVKKYLSNVYILINELIYLTVIEISKSKDKQNFKKNIIDKFFKWLMTNKKDKINSKVVIFNGLIIVNDLNSEVKNYDIVLSNYTYYNYSSSINTGKENQTSELLILYIS